MPTAHCLIHELLVHLYIMTSTRQNKVSRLLQKELADLFQREGKDLLMGAFVTVTLVRVSPDLSFAKVYLSLFGVKEPDKMIDKMNDESKEIRKKLAVRTKNQLRVAPELVFYLDDSLNYAERIDELLKK